MGDRYFVGFLIQVVRGQHMAGAAAFRRGCAIVFFIFILCIAGGGRAGEQTARQGYAQYRRYGSHDGEPCIMSGKQVPCNEGNEQDTEAPSDEAPSALKTQSPYGQKQDIQHDDPLYPGGGYGNQDGRGRGKRSHDAADSLRRQKGLRVRRVGKGGWFGNEYRIRRGKQFSDGSSIRRTQTGHDGDDHFLRVQNGGAAVCRQGMRPFLSRGMERLPPRKRVSPGMILTSPGFRSRAFRAATRGRVGMISPPQRMKSGGETLFSGAGENSSLFSTTVPRGG